MENKRECLDSIGKQIGVRNGDLSPWYSVGTYKIRQKAASLFSMYKSSMYSMLKSVYPEYPWLPWKFQKIPRNAGKNPEILKLALEFIEKEYIFEETENWYRISNQQLIQLGLLRLIKSGGGLGPLLQKFRPTVDWDLSKLARQTEKKQE